MKTFVTAVITTIAVLDILDVLRIIPVLVKDLFDMEIFRHVYCSLGVFHEFSVAIFLVSIAIAVCAQVSLKKPRFERLKTAVILIILHTKLPNPPNVFFSMKTCFYRLEKNLSTTATILEPLGLKRF